MFWNLIKTSVNRLRQKRACVRCQSHTHQSLLTHGEDGRVGLQVDPGAAAHRPQTFHCDVRGVSESQSDEIQHLAAEQRHGSGSVKPEKRLNGWLKCRISLTCGFHVQAGTRLCRKVFTFHDSCRRATFMCRMEKRNSCVTLWYFSISLFAKALTMTWGIVYYSSRENIMFSVRRLRWK